LADQAHELTAKGLPPDADPTVKILAGLFQDETKRAYSAVKAGNRPYARGILNQVSSYCIACHTRNSSGPSFTSLPLEPSSKDLYPIELARFYAATRQFDRALDVFQKILDDKAAPIERPLEWDQAIRFGLAIAVRVKQNPDQALALVERVSESKNAPFFLKQDALKWKESIAQWKAERPKKATTDEGLLSQAAELVVQAREIQKYPRDHAADILYLRASAIIHELLQKAPDGPRAQEALANCRNVLRYFTSPWTREHS
jgi:tetratricopeptide (TPR) repeat protein